MDRDVKSGSYHYYVVSAVNEANIEGMKAGTSLMAVTATAATPARAPDPETDPGSEGPTQAPVPPPAGVVARPYPYHTPTVSWQSSVQGARFIVERLDPTVYAAEAQKPCGRWFPVPKTV